MVPKEEFCSEDGRLSVRLARRPFLAMVDVSRQSWPDETGGVLTGFYTAGGRCALITRALPPPRDSRGTRSTFYRGVEGLDRLLEQLWTRPQREHYLGEWHLHSAGDGSPSTRDLLQMGRISRTTCYQCPKPVLIIVRKTSRERWVVRPYVFSSSGRCQELF